MATSGTFTGSRGGNTYGPWLELDWARQQVDIPNNRSLIRLTLRLHASATLKFSAGKSGNLHGSSFTYTGGFSGTGSKVLRTRDVWVNHNADGSKSQSFSASFNIAVSWGGSTLSSISVSGVANITAIPRASTLSAFSFASNLKPSTAVNLSYTIDRKSTAFRHQIQLRDGTHVVQTWDNVDANGASTVQLSATNVNSLLSRMSKVTSRSLTLRVATRSGVSGGWIGSAVTRNATATVDTSVKPTVSALTVSQTGNSVTAHYLQGMSKVTGKFTRTAVGGATITNSSITVRRKTTENDVQTINSNDGTTGKTVSLTGTYEAQGMAKDSRGRTNYTAWKEFTVTPYTSPIITTFTAVRNASTPTTVNIARAGTHSHLGGSNVLTYTVQRRVGTGAWTNVNTNATGTNATASFTGTSTSTGNSVTSSYDFRMIITDKFGESAESMIAVSTQRVVLDIHKNEGVGIGKIHEQGVLDVDGAIFSNGTRLDRAQLFESTSLSGVDTASEWAKIPQGVYYVRPNNIENQPTAYGYMDVMNIDFAEEFNIVWYEQSTGRVYRKSGFSGANVNSDWILIDAPEYGENNNGEWLRFNDGTQICWATRPTTQPISTSWGGLYRSVAFRYNYPADFLHKPTFTGSIVSTQDSSSGLRWLMTGYTPFTNATPNIYMIHPENANNTHFSVSYVAIGRWK